MFTHAVTECCIQKTAKAKTIEKYYRD